MRALSTALAGILFVFAQRASGVAQISAADAPKATPRLLQQLSKTAQPLPVIVALRDGTPTGRELLLRPDPAGEKGRQVQRIEAQQTLADQMSADQFAPRHFYESFSLISGTASREGILALSRRPDVAWVTFDGKKRALQTSPQEAQVLIRSDSANALGFSGAGSSIAVIDTGVDYTVSQLGGGTFPTAKVIGGADLADGDSDPADCEGHGTEVADIAAGPNGVAPGGEDRRHQGVLFEWHLRRGRGLRHPAGHQLRDHEPGAVRHHRDQPEPRRRIRRHSLPRILRFGQSRLRPGFRQRESGGDRRRRRLRKRRALQSDRPARLRLVRVRGRRGLLERLLPGPLVRSGRMHGLAGVVGPGRLLLRLEHQPLHPRAGSVLERRDEGRRHRLDLRGDLGFDPGRRGRRGGSAIRRARTSLPSAS